MHRKTVTQLVTIAIGMFAFGWALIPLYDLFCDWTGLGGKTGGQYVYDPALVRPDRSRLVNIKFITNTGAGMVWDFWPGKGGVRVHPGELKEVEFYVRNPTDRVMVGRAIPSVVPITATDYFHKTECFCFEEQVLQPGEELAMPMRFIIGPELPKNVKSISLSYELFDITDIASSEMTLARADKSE